MHGWLQTLARGVFCRPAVPDEQSTVPWQQLVISLNALENLPVAAGARTALELQGFSHYVPKAGSREAHLYANGAWPGWVSRVPLDTRLVLHNARRLFRDREVPAFFTKGEAAPKAPEDSGFTQQQGKWKYPLTLSTPERAVLELLDEVPKRETFHQADVLMEGLRNLSPRRLQALLADCRNVKVKRLFLWFAERHNHAWLQKLDRSKASTLAKASACWCAAASWTRNTTSPCRRTSMAASEQYRRQAALLVRTIPLVADRNLLRPQGRHGHQSLCARHAAPLGRHRPHLSAGGGQVNFPRQYRRRDAAA